MQTNVPLAIVGIGCRFPGSVDNPEKFWKLLVDGTDAITEIPPDRWSMDFHNPDQKVFGKHTTKSCGFSDSIPTHSHTLRYIFCLKIQFDSGKDIDKFDAAFFEISPREARTMDPQQRKLLQVCTSEERVKMKIKNPAASNNK